MVSPGLLRVIPPFRSGMETEVSKEIVFDVLRNERRRFAFHFLQQQSGSVTVSSLSEAVAAWELDIDTGELGPQERHRVYVSLLQSHLPLLSEYGLVEFDAEVGTVRLTGRASSLEIYVEAIQKEDIPWPQFFLGLTGIWLGFLMLVWLEIQPFASLAAYLWGVLVVTVMGAAVAYHRYLGHRRLGRQGPPPSGW